MGFFKAMFREIQKQGEAMLAQPPVTDPENPPTRWEKAVVALNGIVAQVSQIDPDGIDVVCFGNEATETYRNIKDTKGLENLVTAKEPAGDCRMGAAMETVLQEAFARGFDERPCSVLVLTAGQPDDHDALTEAIQATATKIAAMDTKQYASSETGLLPLTITFVQVGDDEEAETFLKHLDDNLSTVAEGSGAKIDIVDTIKDEDIKKAMGEFKENSGIMGGAGGALFGAFAGAAMGVGGMYLMNKLNAKKRTEGWNGKWKATFEGEEIAVLTVSDDGQGNLSIEGFPGDNGPVTGNYAENEEGGYNIQVSAQSESEPIYGTVQDKHTISWSDGTRWEEIPPEGGTWAVYAGAAAAGAAAGAASGGASGALLEKKFFKKASKKVPSDYVIVLDRSAMMAVPDTGK